MYRPRSTPEEIDAEAQDLAFGRRAAQVVVVVNLVLLAVFTAGSNGFAVGLREFPLWLWLIQGIFFVLVFAPMFVYRLVRRGERTPLAAARSLHWFVEAVGLAA